MTSPKQMRMKMLFSLSRWQIAVAEVENIPSAYVYVKPSVKNMAILNQRKLEIERRRERICPHTESMGDCVQLQK